MTQEFYFWVYIQKNGKQKCEEMFVQQGSQLHDAQQPTGGRTPSVLKDDCINSMWCVHHLEYCSD